MLQHRTTRSLSAGVIVTGLCAQIGCTTASDLAHGRIRAHVSDLSVARDGSPPSTAERGALRLLYDDLGGLRMATARSAAVPWPLLVAALVYDRESRTQPSSRHDAQAAFMEFGFVFPESLANVPRRLDRRSSDHPLGIVSAVAQHRVSGDQGRDREHHVRRVPRGSHL